MPSISDDDLCATCTHCTQSDDGAAACARGWPGKKDDDGYIIRCHLHTKRPPALCAYSAPGTFNHECGRPAVVAGARPSLRTVTGTFWSLRCEHCQDLTYRDNWGISRWEPLDPRRHRNEWKR